MGIKTYKNKVDLRVLADKLDFVFYVSGTVDGVGFNKRKSFTCTYDTTRPVEAVMKTETNGMERLFLKFPRSHTKIKNYSNLLTIAESDIILEVFNNKQGIYGFESVKGKKWGAFLSHPNYFDASPSYGSRSGSGALKSFGRRIGGKLHALQMVVPNVRMNRKTLQQVSFDLDILIENENQYINSLGLKVSKDEVITVEGAVMDVIPPKQIINQTPNIRLETTYINLTNKDLASREVIHDYKKQLLPFNAEPESINLVESKVYAVENILNPDVNLTSVNLTPNNVVEIPYNVSRIVFDNEIKETKKYFKDGKEIYQLDWAQELFNNDRVTDSDRCYSLKFANKEQLVAFSEKLKSQQIGNIESYPIINEDGRSGFVKRTYSKISQWVERTLLDQFSDVTFSYFSDGLIKTILCCPRKKTWINGDKGTQSNLYTKGGEFLLNGQNYEGYYHRHEGIPMVGKTHSSQPHETLTEFFNYAPISANSKTDFLFTTYSNKTDSTYSGFTATTTDRYKSNDTYDLFITGATFSAGTSIPISNIVTQKQLPLIDDLTHDYRAYSFNEVYKSNGGNVILNNSVTGDYFTYTATTNGIYRFTYKAYLDVKYTDTKWCDYLTRAYPSGMTGSYPSTDYEIKRLINTSIIQAGEGETKTVVQDTNYKFHPGYKFKSRDEEIVTNIPTNSGLLNFNFTVTLDKYNSGSTATTTLKKFNVTRSKIFGGANAYLTLPVSQNDKSFSGDNVCVLSGVSSSTIFHRQIPITIDTGLINLLSGQSVTLNYDTNWSATSKSNYFGETGGTTNLTINLGHKLDVSGNTVEAPWFRGVKVGNYFTNKVLFFDSTKKSKAFNMISNQEVKKVHLDGSLYLTDKECGNLIRPTIDETNFNRLTFIDSTGPNHMLVWDKKLNTPTNRWQYLIENNQIKDYTLTQGNKQNMTFMKDDGKFCFYLPTYNMDYGGKCDFTFPQTNQSYVVENTFKNMFGDKLKHYIVVTPDCNFYKPCSPAKVNTAYNILHKNTPENWRLVNVNKKIRINGKEIKIISSHSHYNPAPLTLAGDFKCQYYCKCGQDISEEIGIDPIYGVSDVYTNLELLNCEECYKEAEIHCKSLYQTCKPVMVGNCDSNDFIIEADGTIVKKAPIGTTLINNAGVSTVEDGGGTRPPLGEPGGKPDPVLEEEDVEVDGEGRGGPRGRPSSPPPPDRGNVTYICADGVCFPYDGGPHDGPIYSSLESCVAKCVAAPPPPPDTPSGEEEEKGGASDITDERDEPEVKQDEEKPVGKDISDISEFDSDKEGICKEGYYWCESLGRCISLKEPCK